MNMTDKKLADIARACGATFELGPGDEPTTGGMMFWQVGLNDDCYPALSRFVKKLMAIERGQLAVLCNRLADYVERVPDDRLNAEDIDRDALLADARQILGIKVFGA